LTGLPARQEEQSPCQPAVAPSASAQAPRGRGFALKEEARGSAEAAGRSVEFFDNIAVEILGKEG